MAQNRVVSKRLKRLNSARSRSIFKGTNPQMTGSNPSQHRSFFNSLPLHRFTRRNHRQRSSRGNTKMMHGFTNQIFAKHWTQGSSAIATPRKHSLPRPLKLNIPASAIRRKMLTEQNRSPISKHRKMPELVPRVRQCHCIVRNHPITNQDVRKRGWLRDITQTEFRRKQLVKN